MNAQHILRQAVFAKKDNVSGNLAFGLAKAGESPTFTSFDFTLNTTYLLVLKYTFVSGTSNDEVSLFVFTIDVPSSEPLRRNSVHLRRIQRSINHRIDCTSPGRGNHVVLRQWMEFA